MAKIVRTSIFAAALALAATLASAAEPARFYTDMLQRGIADARAGNNARAVSELRIAAFGTVDELPSYQAAVVYLTVATARVNQKTEAATAARKAIQSERIQATYGQLTTVDAATRAAFEQLLPTLVPVDQYADLPDLAHPQAQQQRAAMPAVQTATQTVRPAQTPVTTPAPRPAEVAPAKPAAPTPQLTAANDAAPAVVTPAPIQQQSAVAQQRPAMQPAVTQPAARQTLPAATSSRSAAPVATINAPAPVAPPVSRTVQSPIAAIARREPSQSVDFSSRLAEAQLLLNEGKLIAARQSFSRIAQTAAAPRSVLLDAARGLSQSAAWLESSQLYSRLFPLKAGEEEHYFFESVNRYELGDVAAARDFLSRAGNKLPNNREVSLYRARIEQAQ